MNKQIKVIVTEDDIKRAHKNDSYHCVVAQAVARAVKTATNIDVDMQTIRMSVGSERLKYLTPYAVQGYIVAFDAGEKIEPFAFQLRSPLVSKRTRKSEVGKVADRKARAARQRATEKNKDPRAAARAAYKEARTQHPGPLYEGPKARSVPRVHKLKTRAYGQRLLRINRVGDSEAATVSEAQQD